MWTKHTVITFTGTLVLISLLSGWLQSLHGQSTTVIPNDPHSVTVSRRIFDSEQELLEQLKQYSPIFETYIQSLWPDTADQIPLSDAQFLGRLHFDDLIRSGGTQPATVLLGAQRSEARLLVDNGQQWGISETGFLEMLLLDTDAFDADTYRLSFLNTVVLEGIDCLVFDVSPMKDALGRFKGTIWVEAKGLHIIRARGTFQAPRVSWRKRLNPLGSYVGLMFHFDTWRREISPGIWVPAYVVVDDNIPWKAIGGDGSTDIHYKAVTLLWDYAYIGSFESQRANRVLGRDPSTEEQMIGLVADGLVAPNGDIESSMDALIDGISQSTNVHLPKASVRILLTTNIELFHIGNTILISRGLLEAIADESELAALLTHELAHLASDHEVLHFSYDTTLFRRDRSKDFEGFSIKQGDEKRAESLTCEVLNGTRYQGGIRKAAALVAQLIKVSPQVPTLARARFGIGLVDAGKSVHIFGSCNGSQQEAVQIGEFQLQGQYLIDTFTGQVRKVAKSPVTGTLTADRRTSGVQGR